MQAKKNHVKLSGTYSFTPKPVSNTALRRLIDSENLIECRQLVGEIAKTMSSTRNIFMALVTNNAS